MNLVPPSIDALSEGQVGALRAISTATLTSILFGLGYRTRHVVGVRPLRDRVKMVGVARTLRYVPAREDMDLRDNIQKVAFDGIRSGEVLLIDARGDERTATFGDILATRLLVQGAAGIVTDGPVRDHAVIAELGLPVFASGPNPNNVRTVHVPVDTDVPIGCGGVMVVPGDVVVGDDDGVVVVPRIHVDEVIAIGIDQEERERFIHEEVAAGAPLVGTYPMGAAAKERFEAWKARK